MTWQEFENLCVTFLTNKYTLSHGITFSILGGSDSTKPDIKATTIYGRAFFMEAKMPTAQSGQFVVLNNNSHLYISPKNAGALNPHSQAVVDYMSSNLPVYANPGTSGADLPLPKELMASWIKSHYKNKGVKYIISSPNYKNFVIIPISKLDEYFEISAKYRVKRSGSRSPGSKDVQEVSALVGELPQSVFSEGKKYFIKSTRLINKQKLVGAKASYQFNLTQNSSVFEIKKLSNTANPNVIFSINLVKPQSPEDLETFISDLL